jgi:hypothetical protein
MVVPDSMDILIKASNGSDFETNGQPLTGSILTFEHEEDAVN